MARGGVVRDDAVMSATTRAASAERQDPGPGFQQRVLTVLALGQILGGLGTGATLALGALLITEVSGNSALSGMASTMNTLGAALVAIPLARLAQRRGRRVSLTTGAIVAVLGAAVIVVASTLNVLPVLLVGMGLLGAGTALNLQSRFAATDAAAPARGRGTSPWWCGPPPWEPWWAPTSSVPARRSAARWGCRRSRAGS